MTSSTETMPAPTARLPQGLIVGTTLKGEYTDAVEAFRGIPYALPPTGELRFRPPVKVPNSEATIDATNFGPRAPAQQFVKCGPVLEESEDCLTVNVFRKAEHSDASLLPVAVYFHGGAFNRGNAAMHDTAAMVGWSERPFIGISFGYRIGAFGFLPSKLSTVEGVLNLGLKDQICLLEWVEDNIHHFGGDKNNVTLFGLSAGAHSIGHHLLDYSEDKPAKFQRVIIESGAPTSRAVLTPDSDLHEQQFSDFLDEVGCSASTPPSQIFPFLRSLSTSVIAKAQNTVFYKYNPSLRWAFQPVIDGEIIRTHPLTAWQTGRFHKLPILTGFTTNEGSLYVDKQMSTAEQFTSFWKTLLPHLTPSNLSTLATLYPSPLTTPSSPYTDSRPGVGPMYKRLEAAYAHYAYIAPVRQTASLASPHAPVYMYHFALPRSALNGAQHGDTMFFETRDARICSGKPGAAAVAREVSAYWTRFICEGAPGGGCEGPLWTPYSVAEPRVMVFGRGNREFLGGAEEGLPAGLEGDEFGRVESEFWWGVAGASVW